MKCIQANSGLKLKADVRAGGITPLNHNRRGLRVKAGLKAGGMVPLNHNRRALQVKAGGITPQHNRRALARA